MTGHYYWSEVKRGGSMRNLIDAETAQRGIRRMAGQIVERASGAKSLGLVGIRRGGVPLAEDLARHIEALEGVRVPVGAVDISLYRDDASTALPSPQIGRSEIPFEVEGRRIVLVDDVLYTGRTVRAALDALLDYGRPQKIELAVLVDRGGRELPIQPDFVVKVAEVSANDRIDVLFEDGGFRAVVYSGEGDA
jgi:pyrimidine operon attenuation protein/uracil phosphoribosyltransferase